MEKLATDDDLAAVIYLVPTRVVRGILQDACNEWARRDDWPFHWKIGFDVVLSKVGGS